MSDANAVKGHGVKTVVEPSAMFLHRDAAFSKRVADESGLNSSSPPASTPTTTCRSRCSTATRTQIAEIFVHEIENGIQGTGIKAGVHQVRGRRAGRDPQRREDPPRRRPRVACRPAGRSWPTRARRAATGLEQMRIFTEEGVDPAQGPDRPHRRHRRPRLHREAARHRLLDRHGPLRPRHLPADRARNATVLALLEKRPRRAHVPLAGLLLDARLVPAGGGREYLQASEVPNWSMTFLFEQVIPELKERGMTDEQLDQMMVENPGAG